MQARRPPGNWLITPAGRVTALDLESSGHAPVLLEVAQLIEDGPCLPADDAGWAARSALVDYYVAALREHGVQVHGSPGMEAYESFVAYRAAMLLSKPEKWHPTQVVHARQTLERLVEQAHAPNLSSFASAILEQRREPPSASASTHRRLSEHERLRLSKSAAFLLRHRTSASSDAADGWWKMEDLLAELGRAQPWADVRLIRDMLASPSEPRFEVDGDRVRARYGHSVGMPAPVPAERVPSVLYHGTSWTNAGRILGSGEGLLPMKRQAVHLSANVDDAVRVGSRHGSPVVLTIQTSALEAEGIRVHRASDRVWLVPYVPASVLSLLDDGPTRL